MAYRPSSLSTLPSALKAFRATHPYQFPWEVAPTVAVEQQALTLVSGSPGIAPPPAPSVTIVNTLPPASPGEGATVNVQPVIGAAQSIVDDLRYGDAQIIAFQFAAAGSQIVLQRAQGAKRTLLIIVNDLAVGTIRVNFDADASAALGVPIAAGGNIFLDASVPQQNIFVYSPGAGQVTITYINKPVP